MGSAYCIPRRLEMVRSALRCLGVHWILYDSRLLLPSAASELSWYEPTRNNCADRLRRRLLEHFWHGSVHGWHAMGRLSGKTLQITITTSTNTAQYSWKGAHVLVPLLLGTVLIIAFCFWEVYGAKHPMFPSRLKQAPRILALTLVITFISGANFFSIIMFWPTQAFNVYGHDPVGVGIRGIPVGFSILAGACIVLWCLSVFRGRNKELMIISSVLMTAG